MSPMFLFMQIGNERKIISSGEYRECYEAFMTAIRTLQQVFELEGKFVTVNIEEMSIIASGKVIFFQIEQI